MNQITLVVELQQIDTKSDENALARAELSRKLADASAIDTARASFELSDKHAAELKSRLRVLELETNGLADKLKQVSERLYSGRITNAKELAGLNQDERMLQRRKSELEDQELALMEQIENAETTVKAQRDGFERVASATNARNDKERSALQTLDTSDAQLSRKRDAVRTQLPLETLRIYDDLRLTKKGRAVVIMKSDSCTACGTQVPSGFISRIKMGNELVFCTNCGRILSP